MTFGLQVNWLSHSPGRTLMGSQSSVEEIQGFVITRNKTCDHKK